MESIDGLGNLDGYSMYALLETLIRDVGTNKHNIEQYSDFLDKGISNILTNAYQIRKHINSDNTGKTEGKYTQDDLKIEGFEIRIDFTNAMVGKPQYTQYLMNGVTDLTPLYALKHGLTYAGVLTMTITASVIAYYKNGTTSSIDVKLDNVVIGNIPIMLKSNRCHTYNCTRATLRSLKEDPIDEGGVFIAKGLEYIMEWTENIKYNCPHIYKNVVPGEPVRLELISRAGGAFDNSSRLTIRLMASGQITFSIDSVKFKQKVRFPFYLIFRVYDMMSDKDIVDTITRTNNPVIMSILETAFHTAPNEWADLMYTHDKNTIMRKMAVRMSDTIQKIYDTADDKDLDENALKFLYNDFLTKLDLIFLAQMGQSKEHRRNKLIYLGELIYKLLMVYLGAKPVSDRDDLSNKRMHGSGTLAAKSFKSHFNNFVSSPAYRGLTKEVRMKPYSQLKPNDIKKILMDAIVPANFSRAMEQQITTNTDTIVVKDIKTSNKMSTQLVDRRNPLHYSAIQRNIVSGTGKSSNKSTTRADEMRRVHPSSAGYICPCHSAETGDAVGMKKQLAVTCTICMEGDIVDLKLKLLKDEAIIQLKDLIHGNTITAEGKTFVINENEISRVYINGELIGGYNGNTHYLAKKYRDMRRRQEIDSYTTIYVDPMTNELEFWLDVGRLIRPIVIVYNNLEEHEKDPSIPFRQYTKITKAIMERIYSETITLDDLIKMQVVEYITPDEMGNCYLADSIKTLQDNYDNITMRFTHCEIEQAILGFSAHMSALGNHTQPSRITLATNQQRQAGGWYAMNFPDRPSDKNRFFQFYNEMPLVSTITNNHIRHSGLNMYIAYTNYLGDNQEDATAISKAYIDRGGFDGLFIKTETIELEKEWEFGNPSVTTKGIKNGANYNKLINGFIQKGALVKYGDIVIGVIERITKSKALQGEEQYTHLDKSKQYLLQEDAIVEDVYITRNANDVVSGVVKLKIYRKMTIGDKMSSRAGNKSIISRIEPQSNLIYTDSGIPVDIVVNPHSFPTRMAIGQLYEGMASIIAAHTGTMINGTTFIDIYAKEFTEQLVELGLSPMGLTTAYNGITGEHFDIALFIAPTAEQRIQKFVNDDEQCVGMIAPTDPITRQPIRGKNVAGGLRVGEMEVSCIDGHGTMNFEYEKLHIDSDGKFAYICRNCDCFAVVNEQTGMHLCKNCKSYADIEKISTTHCSILLQHLLSSAGVGLNRVIAPREF